MMRFETQGFVWRCFAVALGVFMVCALALPAGFAGLLGHGQAHAVEARSWSLVGDKIVDEQYDGYFPGYGPSWHHDTSVSYTGSSLNGKSDLIREDDGSKDATYAESYSWGTPPSSITVGEEGDITMDASLSMSYTSYNENEYWSTSTGYADMDVFLILSEYDPNASGSSQYKVSGGEQPMAKDQGKVSKNGTTEFAKVQRLNYITLSDGKDHDLGTLWDNLNDLQDNKAREVDQSCTVHFMAEDASSSSYWKYGRRLAEGNYEIDTGENYSNYEGSDDYEAQAYLLTMRVYISKAGYTHDYYYIFKPSATPVATTTTPSEPEEPQEEEPPANPQNVVVETEAPQQTGESGGWVIPAAIVGAAAAVAAGAVAVGRNRKSKGKKGSDKDGQEEQEQSSVFRMVLWKNFGDTLVVGAGSQKVGARIEEIKSGGSVVQRPDLTANITFSVTENIQAAALGMQGPNASPSRL